MYLTHMERTIIKESYIKRNFNMSEIIFTHYNYKKNELDNMKNALILPGVVHHLIMKKVDDQFIVCKQAMEDLMIIRPEYYKHGLIKFDKAIYDMDTTCANIVDIITNLFYGKRR